MLFAERTLAAGLGQALDDQRRERRAAALPGDPGVCLAEELDRVGADAGPDARTAA